MPKVAYTEAEREQIRKALIATSLELFVKQGVQHTTVKQIYQRVGISRTFFYSFFPAKEDLVVQAFFLQQPKLVEHARGLMNIPDLSWRDAAVQFLRDLKEGRFVILTVEEQQAVLKRLSAKNFNACQEKQIKVFMEILEVFDIRADEAAAKLICNLVLPMVVVRKAIPGTLPFLFPDAADEMTEFQISAIVNYMEKLREQQK